VPSALDSGLAWAVLPLYRRRIRTGDAAFSFGSARAGCGIYQHLYLLPTLDINDHKDLKGKSFAFGSVSSTSGPPIEPQLILCGRKTGWTWTITWAA